MYTSQAEILEISDSYLENINLLKLDEEERAMLDKPIVFEEVFEAINVLNETMLRALP